MSYNADTTPLVSVYCMAYNQEKTIAQTIEGIINQKTSFPFELIIHDDASTDSTAAIIKEYAERYPNIIRTIFQTENQFKNCNLIRTFIHPVSRGKLIALCEGDDYWTSNEKLELQASYMLEHPDCTMCFHAVLQLSADSKFMTCRPLKSDSEVSPQMVIKRGGLFCPTASLMLRRDVMDLWPDFRQKADVYDFPLQVLAAVEGKVYYIDKVMAVYRFASVGSWTEQHAMERDEKHIQNETDWLELFNTYTNGKYIYEINYHMAHIWFTEYRKNLSVKARKKSKEYVHKLRFCDRMIFGVLFFMFLILGKHANKVFQILKKSVLK